MPRKEHPAESHMQSVIYMLERHGGKLTPDLVREIKSTAQTALDVLRRAGDPVAERSAFIVLALRQSTEIRIAKHGKGQETEHVAVTNHELHQAAMKMLHELP